VYSRTSQADRHEALEREQPVVCRDCNSDPTNLESGRGLPGSDEIVADWKALEQMLRLCLSACFKINESKQNVFEAARIALNRAPTVSWTASKPPSAVRRCAAAHAGELGE